MKNIYIAGSINMDLVIKTKEFPKNGVTTIGSDFMSNPGGKGANQAVAIAKCHENAKMIGCLGREFGEKLQKTLKCYGVDTTYVEMVDNISSGVAVIVINDNDNRIILDAGSNQLVSFNYVKKCLEDAKENDIFLTQLEIPLDTVSSSIKYAKSKKLITILNPAPAQALADDIYQYLDYFTPNQSECEFYTGIYPHNLAEAKKAALILLDKGVKNVVITMGKEGAVAITKSDVIAVKAFVVDAIDTTAAGDTFVGVMTSFLAKGYSMEEALRYANLASSITVTRRGAQQAIPSLEEILINEEKNNN